MSGRNVFRGPGGWTFNVALAKTFSVTARFKLDIRAEAFNLFNHSSNLYINHGENEVSSFVGTVADTTLPVITATRGTNASSTFSGTSVNNGRLENRNLQLALRLSF